MAGSKELFGKNRSVAGAVTSFTKCFDGALARGRRFLWPSESKIADPCGPTSVPGHEIFL